MTSPETTHLCAILRGESSDLLAGEAGLRLMEIARLHRVDRLVKWRTGQVDDGARADAILDEIQVLELNRVVAGLEARGVAPLVMKGAALAHTHYQESWLRPRIDADLLIPLDRRRQTFKALRELGYSQPPFTSGELVMYQTQFVRTGPPSQEHVLDVHWRIANPQALADCLTYDEMASRARTISVRGQSVRTLEAVDALLLACVHRAAHHDDAEDLLWIFDIHLIAEQVTAEEWRVFVGRSLSRGVSALCARGLRIAVARFQTQVPPDVMARFADTCQLPEPSALYLRKDVRRVDQLIADLRALGPLAGARLVWEHVVPPPGYIGQKYGVRHRAFLPAFYVRRVVEGASKWFSREHRSG